MAPIKVGIIGYGHSTRVYHLPYIVHNPSFEIFAFLQRKEKPSVRGKEGTHCKDDFPDARWYRTIDDFLADKEIDLVLVLTGHDSHAELSEKSLLAGKHVVVEKCFTVTTEEADRVLAAQKKSGKVLSVFQNRRYDSDFRTLKKLIDIGALGKVTECEIHFDQDRDPGPATDLAPGGGMLFGIGSHTLDQALVLFGNPASVTGFYRSLGGGDSKGKSDCMFTVVLQYGGEQSDLVVTIKSTNITRMQTQFKYFARGTDGTYLKFGEDQQATHIKQGMQVTDQGYGEETEDLWGMLETASKSDLAINAQEAKGIWKGKVKSEKGDYSDYYEDVARAVRGEVKVVVDPQVSRDGIRVIELARQSADEGRTLQF